VIKLSENEKPKQDRYKTKNASFDVSIGKNGEFLWAPAPEACSDETATREFIDLLIAMPKDKGGVWLKRLDLQEAGRRCPLLRQKADLQTVLNDLLNDLNVNTTKPKPKTNTQENGGDRANGQE
jgi:hypothetical protein